MSAYPVKKLHHFCNICVKESSQMPRQKINFFELTFVLQGRLVYYANEERYELCKGDAILIPPGFVRRRLNLKEEVSYASFNFFLNDGFTLPERIFLPKVVTEEIRMLLSAFSQSHLSRLYHSEEKAQNLLNYILFEITDMLSFQTNNKSVAEMIQYIDENIDKRITLYDISTPVHLSREYTANLFKKEIGRTLIEYINERKRLIAKNLIQTGNLSMSEIADTLGFDNYGYFSRCFKKHFNTSPRTFSRIGGH